MKGTQIAKAIFALVQEKPMKYQEILKNGLLLAEREGGLRLVHGVKQALLRLLDAFRESKTIMITSAKELSSTEANKIVHTYTNAFPQALGVKTTTDATLIGGVRLEDRTTVVDVSHKAALSTLYKKLIATY